MISMCKEKLYANMEKLEAQIWRCTRQGLKVIPFRYSAFSFIRGVTFLRAPCKSRIVSKENNFFIRISCITDSTSLIEEFS